MRLKAISLPLLILAVFLGSPMHGQSSKKIKEHKIASKTVQEYFLDEGRKEPVVESIEKYNEEGDVVEIQEFNSSGDVKKWEKYLYNDDGKLVEEIFLDSRGRVERTEKNIYKDGLRTEKQYFNSRGKLYKKKVYEYEYRQ